MRFSIEDLEAMPTHEVGDLLNKLALILLRSPNVPFSNLEHQARDLPDTEVNTAVQAMLAQLPANYPQATFNKHQGGYWLEIDHTIIFRDATGKDAVKHTANYVEARKNSPDLPIGVIYGIYD